MSCHNGSDKSRILVFNVGSSSLSFKLYCHSEVLVRGKCHRVGVTGAASSFIEYHYGGSRFRQDVGLHDHLLAARHVLTYLSSNGYECDAVGHRFADGGRRFMGGVLIDDETKAMLLRCAPLAPLHNVAALQMIDLVSSRWPEVTQFVVFDSTFHADMPDVARTYALPASLAETYAKHGFHGLSYADVIEKTSWYLGENHFRAIALHLGTGGSSACAVKDGRSIDTSMGYSPLQGLVMNTRCGDLDPGIIVDLVRHGYSAEDLNRVLHRESGLLGLSGGTSADIRDLSQSVANDARARLAFDVYVYRVRFYIGAYASVLNGLDVLIFTDDVGLRVPAVRSAVCRNLDFLGVHLDEDRNCSADPAGIEPLHKEGAPVHILSVPNDEERAICDEGMKLLAGMTYGAEG